VLFWKGLEALCFHWFLTVLYGSQSETSENRELIIYRYRFEDSSKTIYSENNSSVGLNHFVSDEVVIFIVCHKFISYKSNK
jgi:hypothetical protein